MTALSEPARAVAQAASRPQIVVRPASVALAIPTAMAIEFEISWMAPEPWSGIVGDGCK